MKVLRLRFWLLSVLFYGSISGQSLFETYSDEVENVPRESRKVWVDSLLDLAVNSDLLQEAIKIAHQETRYYNNVADDLALAIAYGLKELSWYESLQLFDSDYNTALYNTARFYYWDDQYLKSRAIYNKVIDKNIDSLSVARSYFQLGEISLKFNDPYAAADYYQRGTDLYLTLNRRRGWIIRSLDLAWIYEEINSEETLQKKLELLQKIDAEIAAGTYISSKNTSILNSHYASYYNNDKVYNFKRSKEYHLRSVEASLERQDTVFLVASYSNLANLYAQERKDSTLYYIEKARSFEYDNTNLTRLLNIACDYYLAKDELEQALQAIHKSLLANTNTEFDLYAVPTNEDLQNAVDKKVLLWGFIKKAEIFTRQFQQTNNKQFLDKALIQLSAADFVANDLFTGNRQENSKLLWRRYASRIYGTGVYVAWNLDKPDLAFYFAERKQAVLLSQNMFFNRELDSLPKSYTERLNNYTRKISDLELELLLDDSLDPKPLYTLKDSKKNFLDSLIASNSKLKAALRPAESLPIEKIQAEIGKTTAILHFLWGNKQDSNQIPTVLLITNDQLELYELKSAKILNKKINQFIALVSKPFDRQDQFDQFEMLSKAVYNGLFPEELQHALKDRRNLIIIPDQKLNYLPFEALITDSNPIRYLFADKAISYAQSASFLSHNKDLPYEKRIELLGLAPVEFESTDLASLPYTSEELDVATAMFPGQSFMGLKANRSNFTKHAASAGIIHLATHAQAGDTPWIALSDGLIRLEDLYSLDLNSELVVLSACNTAAGTSLQGEGIASLSRGFFYSGSRSVMSTRWNTNDKATQIILTDFYRHLEAGKSRAEALQLARIQYLENAELSERSPYYWSSLSLMGEPSAIIKPTSKLYWLIALALIPLLFFLFKKTSDS